MAKQLKKSVFIWEGKDKNNSKQQGEINADSLILAKALLRKRGIIPTKIKKKGISIDFLSSKAINPMDIALFTRQLATMIKSGVPMLKCFDIAIEGVTKTSLKKLIQNIKKDVEEGLSLNEALQKHPKYFDELYCNLVATGEQSGALDTLLDRIATYKEKTESLKARVKKALNYPIIIVLVSVIVTGILLIKVVPQFEEIFQGFGAELPVFTQMVIALSEQLQRSWHLILLVMVILFFGIRTLLQKSPAAQNSRDKFLLKLPVVGPIIDKSIIARFSRTLETTFAAGIPLTDALTSVSGATGNIVYKEVCGYRRKDVSDGQG
ncbi:MAG: type II secretion system F family protein, partial [Endozoicomonadaceae bacterium]|nr:type II secretion system F family protein [Endozoicomonadaceae bacterium]